MDGRAAGLADDSPSRGYAGRTDFLRGGVDLTHIRDIRASHATRYRDVPEGGESALTGGYPSGTRRCRPGLDSIVWPRFGGPMGPRVRGDEQELLVADLLSRPRVTTRGAQPVIRLLRLVVLALAALLATPVSPAAAIEDAGMGIVIMIPGMVSFMAYLTAGAVVLGLMLARRRPTH